MSKLDPQNKYAYYNLGYIAQVRGDKANAESQYKLALAVDPKYDPALYNPALVPIPDREDDEVTGSALFSYKLNWQTVLFLGYSDDRALTPEERLAPIGRALFFKISYAFQR